LLEVRDGRFDPSEPRVDVLPAGRDEVDEERKIVHSLVSLGLRLLLQRLQAADCLVHQAADLREIASNGEDLFSEAVLNGALDADRQSRSNLRGGVRQRSELRAGPVEHVFQCGGVRPALDPLLGAVDRPLVHRERL
jgi:hypothetical protein